MCCWDGIGQLLGQASAPRPTFTFDEVKVVAEKFGKFSLVKNLPSERDQNFLLQREGCEGAEDMVVLKVNHPSDDVGFIECQNMALQHAADAGACCQRLLKTWLDGKAMVPLPIGGQFVCQCRVLTFLPGKMLAEEAATCTDRAALHWKVGKAVGGVTAALLEMEHPAAQIKDFDWDLQRCEEVISSRRAYIVPDRRHLVDGFLEEYQRDVKPLLPKLRRSVVHNDPNDYNLVVKDDTVGVLDFGDMLHSFTCADAAIGMAYLLMHVAPDEPLVESIAVFVRAFHEQCPLTVEEVQAIFGLAVMRVCTSVCMSAYQIQKEPDNEYLLISAAPAWKLLTRLARESEDRAKNPPSVVFDAAIQAASLSSCCIS